MKTKEQLIAHYEKKLEQVKNAYGNDHRKEEYIQHAEENLQAVKNGRQW